MVSKNQTINPGLIFVTRKWFLKRTRFSILFFSVEIWKQNPKPQKYTFCVWLLWQSATFWEWRRMNSLLASFAFGEEAMLFWLLGLGGTHVPIMLYWDFLSFHTRWFHIDYWNHFLYNFYFFGTFEFWFLNFFSRPKSQLICGLIRFNFCLKKTGYIFSQCLQT